MAKLLFYLILKLFIKNKDINRLYNNNLQR